MNANAFRMAMHWLLPFLLVGGIASESLAQGTQGREDPKARLAKAQAMFAERCKKSSEFIHRTAENVEGILLIKIRSNGMNYGNQYRMDDPYGSDHSGDAYIRSFLRGKYANSRPEKPTGQTPPRNAYRYVEAHDPKDGKQYRYTGSMKVVGRKDVNAKGVQMALERNPNYDLNIYDFVLDKVPAPGPAPRNGVTYEDISTREERDYWIAGSSLKVIDQQTNEVMAERIGYMMDRGQGNTSSGRSPWLLAADNACPLHSRTHGATAQINQTEKFVEKVLQPILEK